MKASEGTTLADPTYSINRCAGEGVGLYVGAYHFARPDRTPGDAVAEADYFLAMSQLEAGDLVPVLDLEDAGGLAPAELQEWVKGYLGRIYERTGAHGMIYASPNFWKNAMGDTTWFATNGYGMVWVAHWTSGPAPTVPAANWGGSGWTFWQYTSSGSVPGISGRVDLDRFNGLDLTPLLLTSGVIAAGRPHPQRHGVVDGHHVGRHGRHQGDASARLGAGRSFDLQASADGVTWQTIATITTDAEGNASYSYRPATNLYYRGIVRRRTRSAGGDQPASARVVVRQIALLRPTTNGATKVIHRGHKVTFTTTVRPSRADLRPAKVTLAIYRRVGSHWTPFTTRSVYVNAAGPGVLCVDVHDARRVVCALDREPDRLERQQCVEPGRALQRPLAPGHHYGWGGCQSVADRSRRKARPVARRELVRSTTRPGSPISTASAARARRNCSGSRVA